jgi:hypothetical protein
MSEKSGIEMIEELMKKVDLLSARNTNIETLLKLILNKVNGLENTTPSSATATVSCKGNACSVMPAKIGDPPASLNQKSKTKALGKIKDKNGRMLSGIDVKVLSGKEVVKTTVSNRAGEWMCFLAPGQYKAEYVLEENTYSISFNIAPGQTLIRVAQPKLGA